MKKVTIYNIAFVCLALIGIGALTAFDGSETDEQKIEKAYQVLVDTYNAEQDSLCKVSAMAAAEVVLQGEIAASANSNGGEEEQPAPTPAPKPSPVGGGETQETPPPPPAPEPEPNPIGKKSKRPANKSFSSIERNKVGNKTFKQLISLFALSNPALSLCTLVYSSIMCSCSLIGFSQGIFTLTSAFCTPSILILAII